MNKVILCARLTADPEVRYSQTANGNMAVARYTLAVDRRGKENETDFIRCIAFGKGGEFAEKYLRKGMKILVTGRIQTGKYTDKDGKTVYTTDVVVEEHEFCESKNTQPKPEPAPSNAVANDGWVNIPDGVDDEGLPFN